MLSICRGSSDLTEVILWGAQFENKPYATSYIPTNGGTATRGAESLTGGGDASLINSEEGVLFVEMALGDFGSGTNKQISINDGTTSNRVTIEVRENESKFRYYITSNGSALFSSTTYNIVDASEYQKVALRWNNSGSNLYVNGISVLSGTHTGFPIDISGVSFKAVDDINSTLLPFYGKVKQLIVYKEALTDAELECLTS